MGKYYGSDSEQLYQNRINNYVNEGDPNKKYEIIVRIIEDFEIYQKDPDKFKPRDDFGDTEYPQFLDCNPAAATHEGKFDDTLNELRYIREQLEKKSKRTMVNKNVS